MMMLSTMFFAMGLAVADTQEDLVLAADDTLGEDVRMDAFFRLVSDGSTDMNPILAVARDEAAPMEQRWIAIRVLGRMDGSASGAALIELVDNSAAPVRAAAVEALGDHGRSVHAAVIVPTLEDPAIIVRVSAATALATLGNPVAIPALGEALDDEDNYRRGQSLWVRRYFVLALGAIGDEDAYPILLRTLDDGDQRVVDQTISALEVIAGFSFEDGRDAEEERQAWVRWTQSRLR